MRKKKKDKLKALYAQIPQVDCKGLCHSCCTIFPVSSIERKRTKERLGTNIFRFDSEILKKALQDKSSKLPSCRALKDKRCSIYPIRPIICRLYGAVEGLECPFGCIIKGNKMSKKDGADLIRKIEAL